MNRKSNITMETIAVFCVCLFFIIYGVLSTYNG